MTGYVYAIRFDDTDLFKLGHTKDPRNRLKALQASSPKPLGFFRLLEVGGICRARVFEALILNVCASAVDHGEWVIGEAIVSDAFSLVNPSRCAMAEFSELSKSGNYPMKDVSPDTINEALIFADRTEERNMKNVEIYRNRIAELTDGAVPADSWMDIEKRHGLKEKDHGK